VPAWFEVPALVEAMDQVADVRVGDAVLAVFECPRVLGIERNPANGAAPSREVDAHFAIVLPGHVTRFLPCHRLGADPAEVDAKRLVPHLHADDVLWLHLSAEPLLLNQRAGVVLYSLEGAFGLRKDTDWVIHYGAGRRGRPSAGRRRGSAGGVALRKNLGN